MTYIIFNSDNEMYEVCTDDSGTLLDVNINGLYYNEYPQKLKHSVYTSNNSHETIDSYLAEYSELRLIGSFTSADDYNLYLDNSPLNSSSNSWHTMCH